MDKTFDTAAEKTRLGLALCGSYCTYEEVFKMADRLRGEYDITAIISENAAATDTRFGKAKDFIRRLEDLSGKEVLSSIAAAEPIGPKALLDILLIAPCTGNTLAKLANGITDTSVTMAAKAHMRNGRPLVLALSTNDGLSASAQNIGKLLTRKNIYFVPFKQDDPSAKPNSLSADLSLVDSALKSALEGKQLQPILP